jgi:hypothetical protein
MTKTITRSGKLVVKTLEEMGLEANQVEDRQIWVAEVKQDEHEGRDLFLLTIAEDEDVIQVFASITRAEKEDHRSEVIEFISLYNRTHGRHTHLEYDFNHNTYRVAGQVMFSETAKSLSIPMVRGMILRCMSGLDEVRDVLRAVESGELRPVDALDSLSTASDDADSGEEDNSRPGLSVEGMRLGSVLQQWLSEKEWEDPIDVDADRNRAMAKIDVTIGEVELKGVIETWEDVQWCKCFVYLPDPKIPVKRLDEVKKYIAEVNSLPLIGCLQLLESERTVRYYGSFDVEDATFEPAHINNLFGAGMGKMEHCFPQLMAICFGGKSADEVLNSND